MRLLSIFLKYPLISTWLLFLPLIFFMASLNHRSIILQSEYMACFVHLLGLTLFFPYCRELHTPNQEDLWYLFNVFYGLNWSFFFFCLWWYSLVDPLIYLASQYWPKASSYGHFFASGRLFWGMLLMLLCNYYLITLSKREPALVHPRFETRLWRRGLALLERRHWFFRPDSLYRRSMDFLSPMATVIPALLFVDFLWQLHLPSIYFSSFLFLFFFYWLSLFVGILLYTRDLTPLIKRNRRYWETMHNKNRNSDSNERSN